MTALKTIVVVGGSYCATYLIDALASKVHKTHRIVMIERHSHLQASKITTVPGFAQKAFVPYTNAFHEPQTPRDSVEVVHGVVERVLPGRVVLSAGEEIEYEFLVMATGTGHPERSDGGLEMTEKLSSVRRYEALERRMKDARDVVVVGGGAWGIQLAFDTKEFYPDKNVTLVHSRTQMLNRFHPKLHDIVMARAVELGVDLVLGQRVKVPPGGFPVAGPSQVELEDGRTLHADIAIQCIGAVPLSNPLRSLAPDAIDPKTGYIRVKKTLQIDTADRAHAFEKVFAIGDVADTGANKAAAPGYGQAQLVARNIESMIASGTSQRLEEYEVPVAGIHLSIGLHRYVTFIDPVDERSEPQVRFTEFEWEGDGRDASEEAKFWYECRCQLIWDTRAPGVKDYWL
ncbi:FAD/NAD(P)-binding domain-containing protein [Mycena chlorophos]|uniref:FAD/NAD(P)-binding domain-containing protein n=1 Tax=Mycena chlorophos TaxID=658473 RepID=A0A8H6ST89_MYCCL|nr:FAD/NAD(P)-binding domain-containing protein [Mycena chlorophos]